MTPTAISGPLSRLRQRERWLALAWGIGRWFAVITLVVFVACYIDWRIDRRRDTPQLLRVGLSAIEAAIAVVAFVWWVAIPLLRRRPDHELALFVEDRRPELGHRLISAVQLNRRGAKTAGMSTTLIAAVTREAEAKAGKIDFST